MSDFDCTVDPLSAGQVVTVAGEVDLATAPQVADAVAQSANGDVRLDLSRVTFMDSSGLRTLIVAQRDLQKSGRRLIICGPVDPLVQRTMEITGVIEALDFGDARDGTDCPAGDGVPRRVA